MTGRDAMLARVREALSVPTDPHVRSLADNVAERDLPPPDSDAAPAGHGAWLPQVGESFEDRVALFADLSESLKTDFRRVADTEAAADVVREIAASEGWSRYATHAGKLTDALRGRLDLPALLTDDGYDPDELERCDAGVTGCDALVAQTGSVLISTASAGGRALSVLPEHHVVLATIDQLLPDLPSAYKLLRERYGGRMPSYAGLVTGPSRTGDIERILVLGAHGPKRLTVILIG